MIRPRPPTKLIGVEAAVDRPRFEPAPDLIEWARGNFITDEAPLFNEDHRHLQVANIAVLWTNVGNSRAGRTIVGQAEFQPPAGSMGKWSKGRAQAQMLDWFGELPDFLLTFSAEYAASCTDAQFCALVEHELYHCGQERDGFGVPKFSKDGLPVFAMRGHDIEEFIGVVRRYGAGAAGVTALIEAASRPPEIATASISAICGSCG